MWGWFEYTPVIICLILTALSSTGYFYASSGWLEESSQRLDIFFTLECQLASWLTACFVIIVNVVDAAERNSNKADLSRFSYVILSWFVAASGIGLHHLVALGIWWAQSSSDNFKKHLVSFILYCIFALIYTVGMAFVPGLILTGSDTSYWRIRKRENRLKVLLHSWYEVHQESKFSETSKQAFMVYIRNSRILFPNDMPFYLIQTLKQLYFKDLLSQGVNEEFLARKEPCKICYEPFVTGEP